VTSQNHGYAVRAESLPPGWEVWFENGNDGTVEGIRSMDGPLQHPVRRPEQPHQRHRVQAPRLAQLPFLLEGGAGQHDRARNQGDTGRPPREAPVLGVDMVSIGEVGCIGRDLGDALLKSLLSVGYRVPKKRILLSTGPMRDKVEFLDGARNLESMGYELYATRGTAKFLAADGVTAIPLKWPLEKGGPNIADSCASLPSPSSSTSRRTTARRSCATIT
jgi:hypothetical protein